MHSSFGVFILNAARPPGLPKNGNFLAGVSSVPVLVPRGSQDRAVPFRDNNAAAGMDHETPYPAIHVLDGEGCLLCRSSP